MRYPTWAYISIAVGGGGTLHTPTDVREGIKYTTTARHRSAASAVGMEFSSSATTTIGLRSDSRGDGPTTGGVVWSFTTRADEHPDVILVWTGGAKTTTVDLYSENTGDLTRELGGDRIG